MCTTKIITLSQLGAKKIALPRKPDGHTDRQTDIGYYRVTPLLICNSMNVHGRN